jgi:hypothetical protein
VQFLSLGYSFREVTILARYGLVSRDVYGLMLPRIYNLMLSHNVYGLVVSHDNVPFHVFLLLRDALWSAVHDDDDESRHWRRWYCGEVDRRMNPSSLYLSCTGTCDMAALKYLFKFEIVSDMQNTKNYDYIGRLRAEI